MCSHLRETLTPGLRGLIHYFHDFLDFLHWSSSTIFFCLNLPEKTRPDTLYVVLLHQVQVHPELPAQSPDLLQAGPHQCQQAQWPPESKALGLEDNLQG